MNSDTPTQSSATSAGTPAAPRYVGHTKGPWKCERSGDGKFYVIGDGQSTWGTHVAEVYADDTDRDEARANANLIQDAPDLLRERDDLREQVTGLRGLDLANEAIIATLRQSLADSEAARKGAVEALPAWTQTPPAKAGTYWHWNGDEDCAPLPMLVSWSGFSGKCFVQMGQLGIREAIDCDTFGGWWMPLPDPKLPTPRTTHNQSTGNST